MAGIYLHIPFCKKRCIYCDFYSTTEETKKEAYVDALCTELEIRRAYVENENIETVYLGGGTPSQLNEKAFRQLFDCIDRVYGMEYCKEITLEANPDDLNEKYVHMLRRLPFNRISIGIQTFNDKTLQLLQRRHTARQAIEAIRRCQEAGFHNISIDLIYGLPNETTETWQTDLQQAIDLKVQHISAYHLIYEEGTPLWQLKAQQQIHEIDEDKSLSFFTQLIETLSAAGYEHYEISNFCLPGYYSQHNSSYWTGKKYIGCGPSAHSYNGMSRQWNIASLNDYIREIETGKVPFEKEDLNVYIRYNDRIITSIRTIWGLSLSNLRKEFGEKLYQYCLQNACPHIEQGMMEIKQDTLRLTRQGIFISDGIMSDLLWIDE